MIKFIEEMVRENMAAGRKQVESQLDRGFPTGPTIHTLQQPYHGSAWFFHICGEEKVLSYFILWLLLM